MLRVCLSLAILLAAWSAAAGDRNTWFRNLDRNRDGYLDRKELAGLPRHLAVFDQADENRDGKLDPDEFIRAEMLVQEAKRGARPIPATAEPAKKEPAPG